METTFSAAGSKTTEDLVGDMWCQAVGPKGRDTNGDMLKVSVGLQRLQRFLANIKSTFGVNIHPTIAMQLGTVRALANAIDTNVWPSPSDLILMRDGEEGDVLFVVAAASGVVLELCDLVQLLSFPGKIIGLQLPGLAGETEPLTSIDAIAEHHKANIMAYAASGKSHIIGYSFGGIVTPDLARKLSQAGHTIGLVGIIDATCYEKYWPKSEWLKAAAKRIGRKLVEMKKRHSLQESLSFVMHCARIAGRYVQRRLRPSSEPTVAENSAYYIGGLDPVFQRVRDANIIAFESHQPGFYDGRMVLFRSDLGDPNACDPYAIWKRTTPELKLVRVPGSHGTMIRKPFVQKLAEEISICLASNSAVKG